MEILNEGEGKFMTQGGRYTLVRKDGNESYLKKIIEDAVKAENPRCGIESAIKRCSFNEWEMKDGSHWVSIDGNFSDYARITRRVSFRLQNNKWIEKKNGFIYTEYYEIPGQWCKEHRCWWTTID